LEDYAYKISLSLWPFIWAAILALAIGVLTVIYQALKAAEMNPVDALRYE
jgi:putative ABC transport system permease protein